MRESRKHLIDCLNAVLEVDHEWAERIFTQDSELTDLSGLAASRHAVRVDCVSRMTPLDALGVVCGGWPIVAEYEDGLIRGFK
jgi:hypothetical protein